MVWVLSVSVVVVVTVVVSVMPVVVEMIGADADWRGCYKVDKHSGMYLTNILAHLGCCAQDMLSCGDAERLQRGLINMMKARTLASVAPRPSAARAPRAPAAPRAPPMSRTRPTEPALGVFLGGRAAGCARGGKVHSKIRAAPTAKVPADRDASLLKAPVAVAPSSRGEEEGFRGSGGSSGLSEVMRMPPGPLPVQAIADYVELQSCVEHTVQGVFFRLYYRLKLSADMRQAPAATDGRGVFIHYYYYGCY